MRGCPQKMKFDRLDIFFTSKAPKQNMKYTYYTFYAESSYEQTLYIKLYGID